MGSRSGSTGGSIQPSRCQICKDQPLPVTGGRLGRPIRLRFTQVEVAPSGKLLTYTSERDDLLAGCEQTSTVVEQMNAFVDAPRIPSQSAHGREPWRPTRTMPMRVRQYILRRRMAPPSSRSCRSKVVMIRPERRIKPGMDGGLRAASWSPRRTSKRRPYFVQPFSPPHDDSKFLARVDRLQLSRRPLWL
jgi:hypothetical protein